jgi:hypothetical protein
MQLLVATTVPYTLHMLMHPLALAASERSCSQPVFKGEQTSAASLLSEQQQKGHDNDCERTSNG